MERLFRSGTDKWICGVCGGIAEYADIDPVVIRLAMALMVFASGLFPGLLLYLIAAVIMPAAKES